ncbi:hypothetical protein DFS34DRAFT_238874 [Phlyctochytrium arcticum]|nr:hypothetical protein DFS34DRAFT_238874 [Phlyctochytrium arcticum]
MLYIVTGPTGHVGTHLVRNLRGKGVTTRCIIRNPAKAAPLEQLGCSTAIADMYDVSALTKVFQSDEDATLFYLLPEAWAEDIYVKAKESAQAICQAVNANTSRIKKVVLLSSMGVEKDKGIGFLATLRTAEQELEKQLSCKLVFVRAAYFLENFEQSITAVTKQGQETFMSGVPLEEVKMPMIAAEDIATYVADAMIQPLSGETKPRVVQLVGPRELSPRDIVLALSSICGKDVKLGMIDENMMRGLAKKMRFSDTSEQAWIDTWKMVGSRGEWSFEEKQPTVDDVVRGKTTIDEFCNSFLAAKG